MEIVPNLAEIWGAGGAGLEVVVAVVQVHCNICRNALYFFPPHVFTLPTHWPLLKCEYFQTGCKNDDGGRFYITNMNLQRAVRHKRARWICK